jgi:ferredoxin/flavodoxin---NADP+ reductase
MERETRMTTQSTGKTGAGDKQDADRPKSPAPADIFAQTVTAVKHYTDRLFHFRITRPPSFRFRSGEFVMIGLPNTQKPIFRAYSMASPSWDEEIEFLSIKVQGGPFTEHLQKIIPGDTVLMRKKPTGTLVLDALLPGKRLYLFSTGTGVAPFASLIRDPDTYEKFEEVILVQTCREVAELTYITELVDGLKHDPLIGEAASEKLRLHTTTTREAFPRMGRVTDLIRSGTFFRETGLPLFDPTQDRAMICGSMEMLKDSKTVLESFGLVEGANHAPATYVVERAFVG